MANYEDYSNNVFMRSTSEFEYKRSNAKMMASIIQLAHTRTADVRDKIKNQ